MASNWDETKVQQYREALDKMEAAGWYKSTWDEANVRQHRYAVGDRVTLTDGRQATILSHWCDDNDTPGYALRLDSGEHIGVYEVRIWSLRDGSGA